MSNDFLIVLNGRKKLAKGGIKTQLTTNNLRGNVCMNTGKNLSLMYNFYIVIEQYIEEAHPGRNMSKS